MGSIPGLRKFPGEGNDDPLQYSCLENPIDRRSWWAIVHGITKELDMTEWLNNNNMSYIEGKLKFMSSFSFFVQFIFIKKPSAHILFSCLNVSIATSLNPWNTKCVLACHFLKFVIIISCNKFYCCEEISVIILFKKHNFVQRYKIWNSHPLDFKRNPWQCHLEVSFNFTVVTVARNLPT